MFLPSYLLLIRTFIAYDEGKEVDNFEKEILSGEMIPPAPAVPTNSFLPAGVRQIVVED
jgi:hypothetical protein